MEARGIPFQLGQSLVRIACKDHAVVEFAQGAHRKFGHVDVVFHHQHADAMTMLQPRLRRLPFRRFSCLRQWQIQRKAGTGAGLALHVHLAF